MSDDPLTAKVVTCQELRIVDQDGKMRAIVACTDELSLIQLYDKSGRVRIQAQVEPSGRPAFVLWDDRSAPAISIGLHDDGQGTRGITIHGARGYPACL